ncbi:MAG: acyl carrier protein [Candidatus Bipolaricaulis sp.]|jgi:acyl carrier protein|nr:acyl carrier protein [Candidatus Bipolaricaulis sp.]
MKKEILEIIFECIENLNKFNDTDIKKQADTVLFGDKSELDSLDFVTLIVDVENKIHDRYKRAISITSEKAMSRNNSPFKTVDTLAEYIMELMK